jgi:signal transduction histidine kinase
VEISLPSALSLATGLFAVYTAVLLFGFFSVGRWQQHRYFVAISLSAGIFAALEAVHTEPFAAAAQIAASRWQLACAAVHVAGWAAYSARDIGSPGKAARRTSVGIALALGCYLALGPGIFTGAVRVMELPSLAYVYRAADLTHFGLALLSLLCSGMVIICLRYVKAAAERRPQALTHLCALLLLGVGAIIDFSTLAGLLAFPRVLQTCVALSVLPIAVVLTVRWRQDVLEHELLQLSLEKKIIDRTRDLTETQRALGRTEKLAAVGRLAGGMAHEINNPGAALIANLEYLSLGLERGGKIPADLGVTVSESLHSARRIARTVRQLLLLSRAAIAESEGHSFELSTVVSLAVRTAVRTKTGPALPELILVSEDVPKELRLRGRGQLLEQALCEVLEQLVAAAPPSRVSHLKMRAVLEEGVRVRLCVEADFRGLSAETRALLAEPFQGGRGASPGPSLGLSASLGLLRTLGAEVELEEKDGCTIVTLLLEAAPVSLPPPPPAAIKN